MGQASRKPTSLDEEGSFQVTINIQDSIETYVSSLQVIELTGSFEYLFQNVVRSKDPEESKKKAMMELKELPAIIEAIEGYLARIKCSKKSNFLPAPTFLRWFSLELTLIFECLSQVFSGLFYHLDEQIFSFGRKFIYTWTRY